MSGYAFGMNIRHRYLDKIEELEMNLFCLATNNRKFGMAMVRIYGMYMPNEGINHSNK